MIPVNLLAPLAGVVLFLAALGGAYYKGMMSEREDWEAKAKESQIKAAEQEADWALHVSNLKVKHEKDKAAVQRNLTIALDGLRDRPAVRLPEAARAACAGATGAELSKPDSEFLARESARADLYAGELRACKEYIRVIHTKK